MLGVMIWEFLGEEGNSHESRKTNAYRCRENFQQNSIPFMMKTLQKVGIEETYLNIVKTIYTNPHQTLLSMVTNGKHFL